MNSLYSVSCVEVVLSNGVTVSFWRATFCFSFSLGCLVTSVGQTAQTNETHHWKLCLDTNGQLSLHTLHHYKHLLVRLPPVAEGSGWRGSRSDSTHRESLNWRSLLGPHPRGSVNPRKRGMKDGKARRVGGHQGNRAHQISKQCSVGSQCEVASMGPARVYVMAVSLMFL